VACSFALPATLQFDSVLNAYDGLRITPGDARSGYFTVACRGDVCFGVVPRWAGDFTVA
jgi:hypothetical protein